MNFFLPQETLLGALYLAYEAQEVMVRRLIKFATGGLSAVPEALVLFPEKIVGVVAVQSVLALSLSCGRMDLAPLGIINDFRERVQANNQRLRGGV